MNAKTTADTVSRPTMLLVAGRAVGFAAAFAIPVVLARHFDQAEYGTYKQLFLVFATLYGLAQIGMAESLYFFIPSRSKEAAGRHVANALVTLAVAGLGCLALLYATRTKVAAWLTNSQLADHLALVGVLLALTLVTALFEIVMIARKQHFSAAVTYASSDVARTLLFVLPALGFGGVQGLLVGAVAFGVLRLAAMLVYLWREFGRELRVDLDLWRSQAGVRAALRPGGERGGRPAELPPVLRGRTIRHGHVRHLRGRLPADSVDRPGDDLLCQRDDGADGRSRAQR